MDDKQSQKLGSGWIESSLAKIGLATIVADATGHVLFLNSIAESLTAWTYSEAMGVAVTQVFQIIDERTRQPLPHPVSEVLRTGEPIGISSNIILVGRDGTEWILDEGAAPVRDAAQTLIGIVLVFRDVSTRRRIEREIEYAKVVSEGIVETLTESILVVDEEFSVRLANRAYYRLFHVTIEATEGRSLFEIGDRQFDIRPLRQLLQRALQDDEQFDEFEVQLNIPELGRRSLILSARRLMISHRLTNLILLSIADITEKKTAIEALLISENRYRRLFETAQDGILLINPTTRKVFDANPFLTNLLGFSREELCGKELWEIGLFSDIDSNRKMFEALIQSGYVRYEDLPLLTKDQRQIDVEFVSNLYQVGETWVIQCNIRDITDRKIAEFALRVAHESLELRVRERTSELAETNSILRQEIEKREIAETQQRNLQQQLATAQEEERKRIARELHDQMGQHLTALSLGLKNVKDSLSKDSTAIDRISQLLLITDQLGKEVHELALELRPTALDDLGLYAAISNYIDSWSDRLKIRVDYHFSGLEGIRLAPEIETTIYRIVQESLTNIAKHASARIVSVVVQKSIDQITIVIEDDGKGFNPETMITMDHPILRLGILGMRERIARLNGTITIDSETGHGTAVIVRIPL